MGHWDTFSTRTIGLKVQHAMADEFGGDAQNMRRGTSRWLAKFLGVDPGNWNDRQRWALGNFALVLSLVPQVKRWNTSQKQALVAILKAKAGADETKFLRLMQRHDALREAFLAVGSGGGAPL
jgi:hypothetical protein